MNVEQWLEENPSTLTLEEKLNPAIVGITLNKRVVYDYDSLINQIAMDFGVKDGHTYDHEQYREIAQKYVDEVIMEELEYDSDSPLVIQLFEGVEVW